MLATRPRQEVSDDEERVPLTADSSVSLFAGLNFPEVPKSAIYVERKELVQPPARKEVTGDDPRDMEMVPLMDSAIQNSSLGDYLEEVVASAPPIVKSPAQEKPKSVKGSLSTLYATAEIITSENDNYYPEVPSLNVSNSFSRSTVRSTTIDAGERSSTTQATVSNPSSTVARPPTTATYATANARGMHPAIHNPLSVSTISHTINQTSHRDSNASNSSTVSSTATSATGSTQAVGTQQQGEKQSNSLVDELLEENTRLSSEISHLKFLLSQQTASTPQTQQQQQSQQQAQQHQQHTGVQINDTSRPPAAGVKYVCCGACRQWLLSPKDAVYVVCSRCEAVNNCQLVPLNRRNDVVTQQQQSDLPWFLECFKRPFSG